jgi:hypothetical protein
MTAEELQKVLESLSKVGGVYEYVRQAVEVMNEPRQAESENLSRGITSP